MKLISLILLFVSVISVIAVPARKRYLPHLIPDNSTKKMKFTTDSSTNMKITDLSNDLLNEVIMKMNPGAAVRLITTSKDIFDSIHESEREALYWLKHYGPTALIPYISHLNLENYSEMEPAQTVTTNILIRSYPNPEALVFYAFKNDDSLTFIKFLQHRLKQDQIEEKLRLIKKQAELNPRKYPRDIAAKLEQFGYDNLEIEPLAERFEKLKSKLRKIYPTIDDRAVQTSIRGLTEPQKVRRNRLPQINWLMKESPRVSLELLKSLTEFGVDVDLAIAESTKDPQTFQYLIDNGADVINYRDESRNIPLHWAALNGNKQVVKLLLERDAYVNATDNFKWTPLHFAALGGNDEIIQLLLDYGADLNATDLLGQTPLHKATISGHEKAIKLLLDQGAHHNSADLYKRTALHYAAEKGFKDIVELFLEHDADLNAIDNYGLTPLNWAERNGHTEIVDLLFGQKDTRLYSNQMYQLDLIV